MTPPPPPPPTTATQPQQQPPPPMGQSIAPSGAFPGSLTPGWNDPPPVSADAGTASAGNRRPRLDLRKRVAYPMNGSGSNPQATQPPPPPL
ncbi:steroid receptor RNA activator 1 [Drosophila novamexicana]|uniref:steroid receptor RNA activator 1 n=1 Tax=Drosophila novamexicana TaxID=47314 RepID=UPI0011E5E780|nr:steroid receptor RNA activator 1 [Drosophila novamexicana]